MGWQSSHRVGITIVPPVGESLEPRRLLAGIEAGVLVARGTTGNDTFSVRRTGTDDVIVTTNATSQQFDMDNFTGVRLEGFGGNDTFNLIDPLVSPVVRNTTVLGGAGGDTISYATRTAAISVQIDPNGSKMTSGAQTDSFSGIESVRGGAGDDVFNYGNFSEIAEGDENLEFAITLDGAAGNDRFVDWLDIDNNFGRIDLLGGAGNDVFDADEQGNEFFFGGDGNDSVTLDNVAYAPAHLDGGNGIDSISFYLRFDGNDITNVFSLGDFFNFENGIAQNGGTLIGNDLANELTLLAAGTIQGGGGNDTLIGSTANDLLLGQDGNDWLVGNDDNDTLDGGLGTDTIDGGAGANINLNGEVIVGQQPAIGIVSGVLKAIGTGNSEMISIERTGSDDVIVRIGSRSAQFDMDNFNGVSILGLGGNDVITVKQAIVAGLLSRKVTIDGGGGNDSITGSASDEVIHGNVGSDTLIGLGGRDALFGDAGNDHLFGGLGLDFLDGGDNDDFIDSSDSAGGDTVLGGSGRDTAKVDTGDGASGVEVFA